MKARLVSLALLAVAPIGAGASDLAPLQSGLDYHSFANVEQFRVTHVDLDLDVDSTFKALRGSVRLKIKRLDPRATELVLDTRDLNVSDVTVKARNVLGATSKTETTWVSRPFHFDKRDPLLGSALVVELAPSERNEEYVRIDYETSPTSPALQWLSPAQTAGRHKPFLYTQSEAIGARSWIPLQDTPQVRVTYDATIHTDRDVVAVMSAKADRDNGHGQFKFSMSDAVPSYLIALAVGDLKFKATGPRSGVWAERSVVTTAAKEFADTESMIETAEKLFGPYRWERYDVLVLPPSFPLGGMENPRLTFVSPTILAGDKSLVSVVAHELAHSWSGNLVTNATWRDLWLNEGFTDYIESRIVDAVFGERQAMMDRVLGLRSLRNDFARLPPADQVLAIDLRGRNPDEVFSEVPYEKGRLFLFYLDDKFGRERFDGFLRGYFDHFAFHSLSTEEFLDYLDEHLLRRYPGIVSRAETLEWVHQPGLPADAVLPPSTEFQDVDARRDDWLSGRTPARALDTRGWVTQQWLRFLDEMPATLERSRLAELDDAFALTRTKNAEIGASWFKIVIRNAYQPAYVRLEEYLKSIGRSKMIVPLYRELMKTPAGTPQARRVYAQARPGYHASTALVIDAIVNPTPGDSDEQ